MFNKKNDPLVAAVQKVMEHNAKERAAVKSVNEKFGVVDRKALPREKQADWESAYKKILSEETTEEVIDEAKVKDRVVSGSKKAAKGTKWKVVAYGKDNEGSSVQLRQGKRVKAAGGFYRDTQEFGITPTKKGKMDMKQKGSWHKSPDDILKMVKEEIKSRLAKKED